MLGPVTHYLPLTVIRRERILPQPGKVVVRAGQKVSALDVIAETDLNSEYLLLDLSHSLQIPAEKIERYLQCQLGDQLTQGDVIAGPVGIANRVVRAPKDGRVILSDSGQVLLEIAGKNFQLKAGIPGEVVELIADRGAVVETTGALIQGVWGNGKIDFGVMSVLAKYPNMSLVPADLDVSLRGSIVLGGMCSDAEVLKEAEGLPLRGLILGSLSPRLLQAASRMQIPVMVIEGFGERSINPIVFKLLTTNDRREVALNAEYWDRYSGVRPELVIPLPAPGGSAIPQETIFFDQNQTVRIIRGPSAGQIGQINRVKASMSFPGGLRAPGAEIQREDGEKFIIPLANLEIIA